MGLEINFLGPDLLLEIQQLEVGDPMTASLKLAGRDAESG